MNGQPKNARDIFLEAIESVAPQEWPEFLKNACCGDAGLLQRVHTLLSSHQQDDSLFDQAAINGDSFIASEQPGTVIGPYKLLQQIGEGGFGVVYMAEQLRPVKRKVAVKVIKPGMDTKEVVARFEAERQALAMMDHANIAKVYDGGATESGRPYFVMELVKGIALTNFCDANRLSLKQRLELFGQVCRAIQHAHQKGVIHRDVKPNNVMVTMHDGVPVPKVIDFGVAKAISQELTEKTMFTAYGQMIGTPQYMSPEQAEMSGLDIDTRSDVYSLGILLYELLTGTTPLDKQVIQRTAHDELCRQIREVDAPKPSARISTLQAAQLSTIAGQRKIEPQALRQQLNGDLDRVVLKAIEKDRERRYETPKELASDIERFMDDKPVEAVPPSAWYLAHKYMRRHKLAILTAATIVSILILATSVSTWQAIALARANRGAEEKTTAALASENRAQQAKRQSDLDKVQADVAKRQAIESRDEVDRVSAQRRQLLYASNMQLADRLWHSDLGTPTKIQELLVRWIPTDDQPDLRDFAWRFQWHRLHWGAEQTALDSRRIGVSSEGNLITANNQGVREWRGATQSSASRWSGDDNIVALSPFGRWAVMSPDDEEEKLCIIAMDTGQVIQQCAGSNARFSSNGEYVVVWPENSRTQTENSVDYDIWHIKREMGESPKRIVRGVRAAWAVVSPDGESLALRENSHWFEAHLAGQPNPQRWRCNTQIKCATWAPNGELFVSGHFSGEIKLRVMDTPHNEYRFKTARDDVTAIAFSDDSKQLAVGGEDGKVDVFDVDHFLEAIEFGNSNPVSKDPAADALKVSATPKITTLESSELITSMNAHVKPVREIVFSKNGARVATRDANGTAKLWNMVGDTALLPAIENHTFAVAGRVGITLEDTADGVRVHSERLKPEQQIRGSLQAGDRIEAVKDENGFHEITSDMDGNEVLRLLQGAPDSVVTLHLVDDQLQKRIVEIKRDTAPYIPFHALAFTKDGRNIVVASQRGAVNQSISGHVNRHYVAAGSGAAISRDGRLLALDDYSELVLWDLGSDQLYDRLPARVSHFPSAESIGLGGTLTFSPDGRYVAMGTGYRLGNDGVRSDVKVWNTATQKEIREPLFKSETGISGVAFAPNSESLIATDRDGTLRIWNTATWELDHTLTGLNDSNCVNVSPDGRWMVQGGTGGIAVWDFQSLAKCHVMREESVAAVEFSRDSRTLITARLDGKVVMWNVETGMELMTIVTGSNVLSGCKLALDDRKLAVCSWQSEIWLWDVASIEKIDQHPLTLAALTEQGISQNKDGKFEDAERSLSRVFRTLAASPSDDANIKSIRAELSKSLRGLILKQPTAIRADLGDSLTLRIEHSNDDSEKFTYQWFFAGDRIKGATRAALSIEDMSTDDLGRYHAEIGYREFDSVKVESEGTCLVGPDGFAKGGLKKDVFLNIPASTPASITPLTDSLRFPHKPDFVGSIGSFELPKDVGNNYGVRVSGFLVPPKSGNYVFYLVSDDSSKLFLSTDESPDNKQMIASLIGWNGARRGWQTLGPKNISTQIMLQAGRRYWVEALFREQTHGDHFAVTWQMPGEPPPKNGDPPIPGEFLEFQLE